MKIREDYIGNIYKNKTTHGLKRNIDKNNNPYHSPSFSSFCGIWLANEPILHNTNLTDNDRALLAGAITCKKCRSILNLSLEQSEEPTYYLIIDTSGDTKPVLVELVDTIEEAEKVLAWKLNEEDETPDDICKFRIVGVKEVERYYHKIKSKEYKVKLYKD